MFVLILIVTGSTDGIGKAYAKELAQRGMNIILISRTQEKLDQVAAEIRNAFNVQTKTVLADFKNSPTVFEHIERELKDIEIGILVNNVGTCSEYPIPYHEMSPINAWEQIKVNISSTLLMTRSILPQMRQRNKGAIVNISSIVEMAPWAYFATYSASKAFIKNFTLALQNENLDSNVTIQLVSPSVVKTQLANYSPTLHNLSELLAPLPETFARDAIKTLEYSSHTTGYKPHDLQFLMYQIPNEYFRTLFVGLVSRFFRKQHRKKVEQSKNYSD